MRTPYLNTLLKLKHPKRILERPWACFNIWGKAVFIAAVTSPNLKLCLKGREKGESGQPVFPSFSRVLLQGLPQVIFLCHIDTLCLWPNHRPFTPHLDAASSWILEVMMRNRFQGNHGAMVLWVAPEKAFFSPYPLI